jgi:hypothetical protein
VSYAQAFESLVEAEVVIVQEIISSAAHEDAGRFFWLQACGKGFRIIAAWAGYL